MQIGRAFQHPGDVAVLVASESRLLIGGDVQDKTRKTFLGIVDLKTRSQRNVTCDGKAGGGSIQTFKCLATSAGGRLALSGHGAWGGVRVWDLEAGTHIRALTEGMYVRSVAFENSGSHAWALDSTNHLWRWRVADWSQELATRFETGFPYVKIGEGSPEVHESEPHNGGGLFLPGAKAFVLVTGKEDADDVLQLHESDGPADCLRRFVHGDDIDVLAVSADASLVVTTGWGDAIKVWRTGSGELLAELALPERQERGRNRTAAAAFSPDGRHLLTTHDGPCLRLWDARTCSLLEKADLEGRGTPKAVAFAGPSTAFVALRSDVFEVALA